MVGIIHPNKVNPKGYLSRGVKGAQVQNRQFPSFFSAVLLFQFTLQCLCRAGLGASLLFSLRLSLIRCLADCIDKGLCKAIDYLREQV
ncbi:MAG: hypothetical protein AMJ65_16515 [Phycisphaerae bacterium SG8_4]|nr:MAG: hypothetical protein AMJ65_16515 [Phycisphaerae bacterium SG8_4]